MRSNHEMLSESCLKLTLIFTLFVISIFLIHAESSTTLQQKQAESDVGSGEAGPSTDFANLEISDDAVPFANADEISDESGDSNALMADSPSDFDQIVFFQHVLHPETSTLGDFHPNFWLFVRLMEDKAKRPEGNIPMTWVIEYDAPGFDDEAYLKNLPQKLLMRYVISRFESSRPCKVNELQIEGYESFFTEVPHPSVCEAAILILQSQLVGDSNGPSTRTFPRTQSLQSGLDLRPPGPPGCFFNRQHVPSAESWEGKPLYGEEFMTFGERIIDPNRQDVRICLHDDFSRSVPPLYNHAQWFQGRLAEAVEKYTGLPPQVHPRLFECDLDEMEVWKDIGIEGLGKGIPRCDWVWKGMALVWEEAKIELIIRPNRAMSRSLPVHNPLAELEYTGAFLIGQDHGSMVRTPRISDLSIVSGDQPYRARTIFFARSEAIFADWKHGPGGGWKGNRKPNFLPIYNSGVIQPGRITRERYGETLTPKQSSWVNAQTMLGRKLICYMSSTPTRNQRLSSLLHEALLLLLEAYRSGEGPDFAFIISGNMNANILSDGLPDYRMFVVPPQEYIAFAAIAPHCDVWVSQFGAGSLFWGLYNALPIMLAPHHGQGAIDKDWMIGIAHEKGVCLNCAKQTDDIHGARLMMEGSPDLPGISGPQLYKQYFLDAMTPGGDLILNLKNMQRSIIMQWSSLEHLSEDQNILTNSEVFKEDSDSMVQLSKYILDKVHGVENNYYKSVRLQQMEMHLTRFGGIVRALVVSNDKSRRIENARCIFAKHGFKCQADARRNAIPTNVGYDLMEEKVLPSGCGKKSKKHPCDLCCPKNPDCPKTDAGSDCVAM